MLAEIDATFEPLRGWSNQDSLTAIYEHKKAFHSVGLRVPKGGGSSTARTRFADQMDAIEMSGRVTFHRTNGTRSHWRLTDEADWNLRRLCCWSDYDATLTLMLAIEALTAQGHTNAGLVPDWSLALQHGDDGQSPRARKTVAYISSLIVPALVRDWVRSWGCIRGGVGYKLTDGGRAFLARPVRPALDGPTYSEKANDKYLTYFKASRKHLRTLKPNHGGVLAIPAASGDWPEASTRRGIPPVFKDKDGLLTRTPADMARAILGSLEAKK